MLLRLSANFIYFPVESNFMCAPVSVSMAPTLSLAGILPALVLALITGISGVALVLKGAFARGE